MNLQGIDDSNVVIATVVTEIGEVIFMTAEELTTGSSGSGPLIFRVVVYILILGHQVQTH